jgi:hypothetical protein
VVHSKVYGVYPEGEEEEGSWNRIRISGEESVWDKSKRIATQRIIKYLNRSSDVTLDDIPLKYRNNPMLSLHFIAQLEDQGKERCNAPQLPRLAAQGAL